MNRMSSCGTDVPKIEDEKIEPRDVRRQRSEVGGQRSEITQIVKETEGEKVRTWER